MASTSQIRLFTSAITSSLLLAGCGGGGGGGSGVSSTPTPVTEPPSTPVTESPSTPITEPPPTSTSPPPITIADDEYSQSNAAFAARAINAYNSGATGSGSKIAIIDSGLTNANGEFTGRIDPASKDLAADRGYTDSSGHGTAVAGVAAAARNNSGILGVAFDATVLALRTDAPGSCSGKSGCNHFDNVLASAVDYARTNGADVINMSLGGGAMSAQLKAAVGRATAAGIVIVISAGNCGMADDDCSTAETQPDEFAQIASAPEANGLVIIAGSHDANRLLSDFSNPAGSFGQYYLAALGDGVLSFDNTGEYFSWSGTSFSAPAVSGAVALLAQAFPNLSGAQIVDLLMTTAADAGTVGTDSVYGRGLLNLVKAFQPQGATSLAGSKVAVSLSNNGTLSSAMGDAGAGPMGSAVILDGYSRAYELNLARTLRRAALLSRPLNSAIGRNIGRSRIDLGKAALSVSVANPQSGVGDTSQFALSNHPLASPKALGGKIAMALGRNTTALASFGERIAEDRSASASATWLAAQTPDMMMGFDGNRGLALGVRQQIGGWSVTTLGESGTLYPLKRGEQAPGYTLAQAEATNDFGPLNLRLGAGMLIEQGSVLGARFSSALGGNGASSRFLDLALAYRLGGAWAINGQFRQYWTSAEQGGALDRGRLSSNSFSFDVTRMGTSNRLGLRIAQPLRVASGGYRLMLPSGYDYATRTTSYTPAELQLAPKGREIDVEASYGRMLGGGWIDTNLYLRRQPGNIATTDNDIGAAIRYSLSF